MTIIWIVGAIVCGVICGLVVPARRYGQAVSIGATLLLVTLWMAVSSALWGAP